jgi:O-antigen/teichoic acid export membrane protein
MAKSPTIAGRVRSARRPVREPALRREPPAGAAAPRRIVSNFAALSLAEVACRLTSVLVTLYLARRLGRAGFGRVEFAFNVVVWLVLLVREGFDVLGAREIARHRQLVRPLVNHLLALRGLIALGLLGGLLAAGGLTLSKPADRAILGLYGLLLLTTALGLDFVFRGLERMGLLAVSLTIRTGVYALGVAVLVRDPSQIVRVPACLVAGEALGIAMVWACYARRFGLPRPNLGGSRRLRVLLRRGRPVYMIQVAQAVVGSIDLLIVGLMSRWADVGLYSAPHRMVTAVLTFGLIFQQVVLPGLARSWRDTPEAGRRMLDALVRVLVLGFLPLAVGVTVLAGPMVEFLFQPGYADARPLLLLGIWRAPLLSLAFLYQTALIALDRESSGVRSLLIAAVVSAPIVAVLRQGFGLPGAALSVPLVALGLAVAGYRRLAAEGRAPAWHHHLVRPLLAALAMVPVCLALQRIHLLAAIAGGGLAYGACLILLGGLRATDLALLLRRPERRRSG